MHVIVGTGNTGQSIARFLNRRKKPFCWFDTRREPPNLDQIRHQFPAASIYLEDLPDQVMNDCDAVISSPGVPLHHPVFQRILAKEIPLYGDIECLASELDSTIIAVTGTNGKSTVATLVCEMAKANGLSVALAGNIGTPVLDMFDSATETYDLWVLELSSFQLALTQSLIPKAATILNVSPDHLDWHTDFEDYVKAKQRIYTNATVCVYNRDDKNTYPSSLKDGHQQSASYGLGQPSINEWGMVTTIIPVFFCKRRISYRFNSRYAP